MFFDWFIALKFLGALGLMFGLGWIWNHQGDVAGPYIDERSVEALRIEPLTFSAATIPPDDAEAMVFAVAPETAAVPLEPVRDTTPVVSDPKIRGGSSILRGIVSGLGEDDRARVLLTRITDGGEDEASVPVDDDGSWQARGIHGGRYRVRAFVPGLRASNGAAVLFLAEAQDRVLDLSVTTPPTGLIFDVTGSEGTSSGAQMVVAVTVGRNGVDDAGRSVVGPVAGLPLTGTFSPVVTRLSAPTPITDGGGAARFLLRCNSAGTASITIGVVDPETAVQQNAVLTLPACVAPPPPPEPEPAAESAPAADPVPAPEPAPTPEAEASDG